MDRRATLLVSAVLLATPAMAAPSAMLPGIYGNMIKSRADGDVEGVEVRIARRADRYRATFVYGEGGCDAPIVADLTPDGDRWRFDGAMVDYPGASPQPVRFWLRAETGGLRLIAGKESDWIVPAPHRDRLRAIRRPLCLR